MPKSKIVYRIGTRGSLLATTQSTLIKNQLEDLTGDQFEIVKITTQGDLNTSAPLWQLEGKDFFTKELDQALREKEIDLVIHSYKDLGTDRPESFHLAAITERTFAQDILLIKQSTIDSLSSREQLLIGTSSPRRIYNIEKSLSDYLPCMASTKIETKMLRGNVNTRIEKLQQGLYDGIILALAGLERLAHLEPSASILKSLLSGLNFMVLPQSAFPAAAAQGALAIECLANRDDQDVLSKKLALLNHPETKDEVNLERKAFTEYGGGCHLAVGIHVKKVGPYFIQFHKGQLDGKEINFIQTIGNQYPLQHPGGKAFIGLTPKALSGTHFLGDEIVEKVPQIKADPLLNNKNLSLFVTSKYCFDQLSVLPSKPAQIWVSGNKTFKTLAKQGFWINGSSDSFGHDYLLKFKNSKVLNLFTPSPSNWVVLGHQDSHSVLGHIHGCYLRVINKPNQLFKQEIEKTKIYYWTSFSQYKIYQQSFPEYFTRPDLVYACGYGKTYQQFKKEGIKITPFYSIDIFKKWADSSPKE